MRQQHAERRLARPRLDDDDVIGTGADRHRARDERDRGAALKRTARVPYVVNDHKSVLSR